MGVAVEDFAEDSARYFMENAARGIGRALLGEGLGCNIGGGIQGPHTLTFGVQLHTHNRASIQKALGLQHAIAHELQISPIRIYTEHGWLWVEIPSPWPRILYAIDLIGARRSLAVPLGMTSRQTIHGIDFESDPHLLVIGPTKAGKTTAIRAMLYQLQRQNRPHDVEFYVMTVKPIDWQPFANILHTRALIKAPAEAAQCLEWLRLDMVQRTTTGKSKPHRFIVIDDALNMLSFATGMAAAMREIVSLGQAAGLHLILGTQSGGKDGVGDPIVARNIRQRLIFGMASAQDASLASGRSGTGAEMIGQQRGDALHVTEHQTVRVAVAYLRDSDLSQVRINERARPWLAIVNTTNTSANTSTPVLETLSFLPSGDDFEGVARSTPVSTPPNTSVDTIGRGALPRRPTGPTPDERATLRKVYAELHSANKTIRWAWGSKDPKTHGWLTAALQEGGPT